MSDDPISASALSRYGLYGEPKPAEDAGFIHIEDIPTRSRLHGWRITPHLHPRMFQIVCITGGGATARIDHRPAQNILSPGLVSVPGGTVHAFEFEPETTGWVLTVSEALFSDRCFDGSREVLAPLLRTPFVIDLADKPHDQAQFCDVLASIERELQHPRTGSAALLSWLTGSALIILRRMLDQDLSAVEDKGGKRELFHRFRVLLEEHYRHDWPVSAYASALAISQAKLGRLCHAISGKGAVELIQDRVILEASRYLVYTTATVAMIAYELGFKDPAYFSRFFRKRTGMTPLAYRAEKLHSNKTNAVLES